MRGPLSVGCSIVLERAVQSLAKRVKSRGLAKLLAWRLGESLGQFMYRVQVVSPDLTQLMRSSALRTRGVKDMMMERVKVRV